MISTTLNYNEQSNDLSCGRVTITLTKYNFTH